jgi:hypothetical protein
VGLKILKKLKLKPSDKYGEFVRGDVWKLGYTRVASDSQYLGIELAPGLLSPRHASAVYTLMVNAKDAGQGINLTDIETHRSYLYKGKNDHDYRNALRLLKGLLAQKSGVSVRDVALGIYRSPLDFATASLKRPSYPNAQAVLNDLKRASGVRDELIRWAGLDDYLENAKYPLPRAAVIGYINANRLDVKEVFQGSRGTPNLVLGPNDFARVYDLPERFIPARHLDGPTPSSHDARKELLVLAARSLGVATHADLAEDLDSAGNPYTLRRILQLRAMIGWLMRGTPSRGMSLSGHRAPVPCPPQSARAPP